MASLSNYAQNNIINHMLRGSTWVKPSSVAVVLLTSPAVPSDTGNLAGKEVVNANGYVRQVIPVADSSWQEPVIGITSNLPIITFPKATGAWGTVIGTALVDNGIYGSGNLLIYGLLNTPRIIADGDIFRFDPNTLITTIT